MEWVVDIGIGIAIGAVIGHMTARYQIRRARKLWVEAGDRLRKEP